MKTRALPAVAELLEDLQDLYAVGGVQGADRLVEDDQGGLGDQGAGHGDTLALAAGELAGQPAEQLRGEVDPVEEARGPAPPPRRATRPG